MKRNFLLTFVIILVGGAFSNAQTTKAKDTTLTFKYLISSDWTFTFGNLNSFITVNQAQFNVEQRVIGATLVSRYRYGAIEGIQNYNEFYTNAELKFFPKNRVYAFMNGGAEFSFLRGVNLRAWGGLGAGFKVLNLDDHKFEPTISFNYEYNDYTTPIFYRGDSTDIVHTTITNVGWTGSHKFLKGKMSLVHNFLYNQDLLFASNFKFNGGFTLGYQVYKNLMVKTAIVGSYQNVVPVDKRQGDLIWTIGLAWGNM